jgi:16S rRNA (guanine1207-N2)-methyltransferase
MNHYFTDNKTPDPKTEKHFTLHFRSASADFVTNEGMFSHGEADPNSVILMRTISMPLMSGRPSLLDLGCGYGLIGVMMAKGYGYELTMSDVNGSALYYAEKNAAANGVTARIIKSDGFEHFSKDDRYDVITLNPPIHAGKDVCFALYEGAAEHLTPGGRFTAVFMDKHGGKTHRKKLGEIFRVVEDIYKKDGVTVVLCLK